MPNPLTWQEKYLRRQCGLTHQPPMMAPDADDPAGRELTTEQAAAAAHVTEARIRAWAARGLITAVNPGEARPRYLELDVLKVEARTRRAAREQELEAEAEAYFRQAA